MFKRSLKYSATFLTIFALLFFSYLSYNLNQRLKVVEREREAAKKKVELLERKVELQKLTIEFGDKAIQQAELLIVNGAQLTILTAETLGIMSEAVGISQNPYAVILYFPEFIQEMQVKQRKIEDIGKTIEENATIYQDYKEKFEESKNMID